MSLPNLPVHPEDGSWASNIHEAHQIMNNAVHHANSVLSTESDPLCLKYHIESLTTDIVPIPFALEDSAVSEGLPTSWLHECTEIIGALIMKLCKARDCADARSVVPVNTIIPCYNIMHREDTDIQFVQPVSGVQKTGKRGRPRKIIALDFLQEAMLSKHHLSLTRVAQMLGIHHRTLTRHLVANDIFYKFTALSDADLDLLVKTYRMTKPESGIHYLIGFLRHHGLRVQKRRVTASIHRVDGLGHALHQRKTIQRRKYTVSCPNALWHVDGHHKLILWGIVIHGFVDGYCRTVSVYQSPGSP